MIPRWARTRPIIAWCLYDLANSVYAAVIPATIWSAYYAGAIVGGDEGTKWWGRAVSATMLIVAVTSPLFGAVADLAGWRKRLLVNYTLVAIAGTALLSTVRPGMVIYGFVISVIAGVGFEGATAFYNSYLNDLTVPERRGRVSAIGFAVGYAGSFIGLAAVFPLVRAQMYPAAFALAAALFGLFAIPAFLWLPHDQVITHGVIESVRKGFHLTRKTVGEIVRSPALRWFFLAYLIYEDGINTIIVFSSIFARQVLNFSMTQLILVYICVQVSALIGAALWARPSDTKGPKFVVMATLAQWAVVVTLIYFVETKTMFFIVAALAGTGLGAVQSASRAFMASLIPKGRDAEYFGFYSLCGKGAAIFGPLIYGEIADSTGNQRLAALSILAFFVVGIAILATIKAGGPTAQPESRA